MAAGIRNRSALIQATGGGKAGGGEAEQGDEDLAHHRPGGHLEHPPARMAS